MGRGGRRRAAGPRAARHAGGRAPLPLRAPRRGRDGPRLPDGTPFPTLYYLTCPRAAAAIGGLEAAGRDARDDRAARRRRQFRARLPPGAPRLPSPQGRRGGGEGLEPLPAAPSPRAACRIGSSACTRSPRTNSLYPAPIRSAARPSTRRVTGGRAAPVVVSRAGTPDGRRAGPGQPRRRSDPAA